MLPEGLLEQRLLDSEVFPLKTESYEFAHSKKRITPKTLGRFVGTFYEGLSRALFGGVIGKSDEEPITVPDIRDKKRERWVEVKAASLGEAVDQLVSAHPAIRGSLLDADGHVKPFVRVFVGSKDMADLDGVSTPLHDGDVVSIVPPIAGA